MEALFEAAVDTRTYLEINSFPDRLDLKDIHVKRAKELGVQFVIGTDSHEADQLKFIQYGLAVARRGWLEPDDCLNTKPLAELLKIFGGKKTSG
jgi:DNA polymerase (family 10)